MIPQAPIIPPPIPSGFDLGGIPSAPLVPPEFDPEADVLLPPPPMAPSAPPSMATPPASPTPEAPRSGLPQSPLLDTLGAQPAPAEGPDIDVARGWARLGQLGAARTQAEREAASAAEELRQHAAAYQSAKTPAEQAKVLAAAEQAKQRIDGAGVAAQAAGLAMEREQAAQQAAIDEAVSAERTARYQEAAAVLDARAADTQARVASLQAERARAQERRQAREKDYAALLDRGAQDTGATWTTAVGMIGEIWSAFAQNRAPNLDTWLERGLEQARTKHAGELDALRVQLGADEQAIDDIAVEVAQRQADDLAFEQAYLGKLDRDLALLAAQYSQTPQGMAAEQARRQVAAQQQARAAESQSAYDKAERERAKAAAELRKTNAEAALLERKLQGGGAAPGKTFGERTNISEDALVDPITGVVLGESRFQDRGKVREDQDIVNKFSTSMEDIETYVNLLEKVGKTYQGFGAKSVRSADIARLNAMHGDLFMKTRQALTGAAASAQEEEIIRAIIPPPKAYTDMGSWNPSDVMRLYRDRMSAQYKNFLTSRLKTGGTLIRNEQGETLPTSPTYGFDVSRGDAPVDSPAAKIIEALAREYPENPVTPMRETLIRQAINKGSTREQAETQVDRREATSDPFQNEVEKHWRAALDLQGEERAGVVDALARSRDALRATGMERRAKYLDTVLQQLASGKRPEGRASFEGE